MRLQVFAKDYSQSEQVVEEVKVVVVVMVVGGQGPGLMVRGQGLAASQLSRQPLHLPGQRNYHKYYIVWPTPDQTIPASLRRQ